MLSVLLDGARLCHGAIINSVLSGEVACGARRWASATGVAPGRVSAPGVVTRVDALDRVPVSIPMLT